MKNKMLYYILIMISIILILVSLFLLDNTKIIAPIIIVISIYLFLGAIIKLCKTNNKLKNTILCALDLLFWLP
jgi:hypothetical protein